MDDLELVIIRNIINDRQYMRKVTPFIKGKYFENSNKIIFDQLKVYVDKYNEMPTEQSFRIELQNLNISDEKYNAVLNRVTEVFAFDKKVNYEWLVDATEKWVKDRELHLTILDSIEIINGNHKTYTKNVLPELLSKALSVSFDNHIGHDYIENADDRWNFYNLNENKIPFDLEYFNKISDGGAPNKTLIAIMAGVGVGKSLAMCHFATSFIKQMKNVLYITLEMSENKIAERIDANLFDVPINKVKKIDKKSFMKMVGMQNVGKLIIKEYPSSHAHAGHFRALLNELKIKKDFVPDVIFVDYLNICASSRIKSMGGSVNSYMYVKAIAEEIRGLAGEFDVPIITATQVNRDGYNNSDFDMTNVSESFGLPATADIMVGLITSEELEKEGMFVVKQLKNRNGDPTKYRKFIIGVDREKMRLFNVNESEQTMTDVTPVHEYNNGSDSALKKLGIGGNFDGINVGDDD